MIDATTSQRPNRSVGQRVHYDAAWQSLVTGGIGQTFAATLIDSFSEPGSS